jgi:probable selenium-dependent hydroxylase accessory protein YqeC
MKLAAALLPLLPGGKGVIAFVGAGGKTSALFRLASAMEGQGRRVLITTTTHLLDPRDEPSRPAFDLVLRPDMEAPIAAAPLPEARAELTVLLSRVAEPPGKMKGIHPSWIPALRTHWDLILVEADGSKRLPVKAPAPYEPVIPPGTNLVVGVVGLDCLGQPMDSQTVHCPERFGAITGCATGAPILWEHLVALVGHPEGLFKGAPGARVLLFNKADRVQAIPSKARLADLPANLILVATLEPMEAVLDSQQGRRP